MNGALIALVVIAIVAVIVWYATRHEPMNPDCAKKAVKAAPDRKSPDGALAIANALIPLIEANDYTHEFRQGTYIWRFAGVKNLNVEVFWRVTDNVDSTGKPSFLDLAWMPTLRVGGNRIGIEKDVRDILRKGWGIAEARREAQENQEREAAMKSALAELQEYTPVRRKQPRKPKKTNKGEK